MANIHIKETDDPVSTSVLRSLNQLELSQDSGFTSMNDSVLPRDELTVLPYHMNHGKRGRLLVICNSDFDPTIRVKPRGGTKKDIAALQETFRDILGFEWTLEENLNGRDMFEAIKNACQEDHSDRDCIMIVILSHGMENGEIFAYDELVKLEDMIQPLKLCDGLAGKPKLIFVQACRGKDTDKGISVRPDAAVYDDSKSSLTIPVEADFLYAYSTAEGYVSFNNPTSGSWFIQALCKEFKTSWRSLEIMQMLTRVCHKLAYEHRSKKPSEPKYDNLKQVSCVTTTLTKALYFPSK